MPEERRRAPRYRLISDANVTDLRSKIRIRARTSDFSLVGCFMNARLSLPTGTDIEIDMTREGETFHVRGTVARVHTMGMGVSFSPLKRDQEKLLATWLLTASFAQ